MRENRTSSLCGGRRLALRGASSDPTPKAQEMEPRRWGTFAQATRPREGEAECNEDLKGTTGDTLSPPTVSTQLQDIARQAHQNPERVFTTPAHRMDVEFLREAYRKLNKKGAPGLNKVTASEYGEDLEENLIDLHQRLRSGRYRAPPIKRGGTYEGNFHVRVCGESTG